MHVIQDGVKREIMFAICDTCGAQAMCFDLGEDNHICEACDWAPKLAADMKARDEEMATLKAELAKYKSMDHNQLLANAAARYLLDMGAENYTGTVFAITLDDQGEQFEVVVMTQKVGAKSPHEMHAEVEERNKELSRLLQWARQILPHRHTKIREEIDAALKSNEVKP